MTGKEVETVATLLKRVRERADQAKQAVTRPVSPDSQIKCISPGYVADLAEGLNSLAAAVEMCSIDLADLRRRLDTHAHYDEGRGP